MMSVRSIACGGIVSFAIWLLVVPVSAQCEVQRVVLQPAPGYSGGPGASLALRGDLALAGAPISQPQLVWLARGAAGWGVSGTGPGGGEIGQALALSGSEAFVSAPRDSFTGRVYVYDLAPQGATQVLSGAFTGLDRFGDSLAVDGARMVIGAPTSNSNRGLHSGVAFVFERIVSQWVQVAVLEPNEPVDSGVDDNFGLAVAIAGDRVLVGAPYSDDAGPDAGAGYVFERVAGVWSQQAKLLATGAPSFMALGGRVALDGATALLGSVHDTVNGFASAGAVRAFEPGPSGWVELPPIVAADPATGASFGSSLSAQAGRLLVGASGDAESGAGSGAAYLFTRSGSGWTQLAKFRASDSAPGAGFGTAVAIDGTTAVVSAFRPQASHLYFFTVNGPDCNGNGQPDECDIRSGVDGDCNVNTVPDSCDLANGSSADRNGDGVPDECQQGGASFCFGDGSGTPCPCGNESAPGSGSGCTHSFGYGARLTALGHTSISDDTLTLLCDGMPPLAPGLYFQGTGQDGSGLGTQLGDGLRCAGGAVVRLGVKSSVAGSSMFGRAVAGDPSISVRGQVPSLGATRYYQVWYRNALPFCMSETYNFSNGIAVTWTP